MKETLDLVHVVWTDPINRNRVAAETAQRIANQLIDLGWKSCTVEIEGNIVQIGQNNTTVNCLYLLEEDNKYTFRDLITAVRILDDRYDCARYDKWRISIERNRSCLRFVYNNWQEVMTIAYYDSRKCVDEPVFSPTHSLYKIDKVSLRGNGSFYNPSPAIDKYSVDINSSIINANWKEVHPRGEEVKDVILKLLHELLK